MLDRSAEERAAEYGAALKAAVSSGADTAPIEGVFVSALSEAYSRTTNWQSLGVTEQLQRVMELGKGTLSIAGTEYTNNRKDVHPSAANRYLLTDKALLHCALIYLLPTVGESTDLELITDGVSPDINSAKSNPALSGASGKAFNRIKLNTGATGNAGKWDVWILLACMIGGGALIYALYSLIARI